MLVINDPFGHTHSLTSSDHYFHAMFVLLCCILKNVDRRTEGRMYRRKARVKIMITTGRDCGSAGWIKTVNFMQARWINTSSVLATFFGVSLPFGLVSSYCIVGR